MAEEVLKVVTGKDRRVVRGWKKGRPWVCLEPAPRALPQSSQQARPGRPLLPLLPLSREPAGPWERGVWNQTV